MTKLQKGMGHGAGERGGTASHGELMPGCWLATNAANSPAF